MLYLKAFLLLVLLCGLTFGWTTVAAQPTLPIESIPEDLPTRLRRSLELLYDERPGNRMQGLETLRELGPQALQTALPFLVSMMGDTGEVWDYCCPYMVRGPRVEDSLAATVVAAGASAREPLLKALDDESVQVRRCAVKALGLTKDSAVAQRVATLADDAESGVRAAVAESLGLLAHPETVGALAGMLVDQDESVRKAAAKSLLALGEPGVDRLVQAAKKQSAGTAEAFEALASAGEPRAVGPLLSGLSSEDAALRASAAKQLAHYKAPEVTEGLVAALGDRHPGVREIAAFSLASSGDATAVPGLIAALKDDSSSVRMHAAYALEKIADPRAVEPLIRALKDRKPEVADRAACALGAIGDRRAVAPLIEALDNPWYRVQEGAAQALGEINDPRAVEPLIALLVKTNEHYAAAAEKGQRAVLRWERFPSSNEGLHRLRAIIEALGRLGDARAIRPILDTLKYADCGGEVAEALSHLDIQKELDALLSILSTGEQRARCSVARALAHTDDPRAIAGLIAALKSRHSDVHDPAADSLRKIGEPAAGSLAETLAEGPLEVRRQAARILSSIKSIEAIPALISALREDDKALQDAAAEALWQTAGLKLGLAESFGRDADAWQAWWEAQPQKLQKKDEPSQD